MKNSFQKLARYNAIANQRIYNSCAELSDAERKQNRGAFFKSIHATLNHLMVGDLIWINRLEETPLSINLDSILYESFETLWQERQKLDSRIVEFINNAEPYFFEASTRYVSTEGETLEADNDLILMHFFNHQTHHRGQIHTLLTQAGANAPVLDIPAILENGA